VGAIQDLVGVGIDGGALVSLVAVAILAVWRGWLVPRVTLDRMEQATARVESVQAQRLADSQEREHEWREAWLKEKARGDLQADQISELLELARTTDAALRALKTTAGG
jgi:hypothetical protein